VWGVWGCEGCGVCGGVRGVGVWWVFGCGGCEGCGGGVGGWVGGWWCTVGVWGGGSLLTFDIPQTALVATLDTYDFKIYLYNEWAHTDYH
jgi:hypothetical protein